MAKGYKKRNKHNHLKKAIIQTFREEWYELLTVIVAAIALIMVITLIKQNNTKDQQINGLTQQLSRTQMALKNYSDKVKTYRNYLQENSNIVSDKYNNGVEYIIVISGEYYIATKEEWDEAVIGQPYDDMTQLEKAE